MTALYADPLRWLNLAAWLFCLACLAPAVLRAVTWRGRYLDPLWCVVFLLALNRLSFLLHLPIEGSRVTAMIFAVWMGFLSASYQRKDTRADPARLP